MKVIYDLSIGDKVCYTDSSGEGKLARGTVFRLIGDNVVISWENKFEGNFKRSNRQIQYTPDQIKEFISIDYQSIRSDKLEQLEI